MQLHTARLCLDCQEVHDGQTCPICSSESFAYISRWIPAPERRVQPRAAEPAPQVELYRQLLAGDRPQPASGRWLKRGVFGLAAVSAAAWALKGTAPAPPPARERPLPPAQPAPTSNAAETPEARGKENPEDPPRALRSRG